MVEKTLYSVLQVSEDATSEVIHAAYARYRELYEVRAAAGEEYALAFLKAAREAFLILSDKSKRTAYDYRLLQRRSTPEPSASAPLKWVGVFIVACVLIGYFYHRQNAELERQREEARLLQEKLQMQQVVQDEEAVERAQVAAARKAAYEEQRRLAQERAWFDRTRREGDEVMARNARAEQQAQQQAQREEAQRKAKIERDRMQEEAAARRRLEEEKSKLRHLESSNRTW